MQLQYGGYTHQQDEVTLVIDRTPRLDNDNNITAILNRWRIICKLHGDDIADLNEKIAALESAYSQNGRDAVLLDNEGNPTVHRLRNSQAIDGVKVIRGPLYPLSDGIELVALRTVEIELEAEIATAAIEPGNSQPLTFTETVEISGGGPQVVHVTMDIGPPEKQVVAQQTPFRATQSGTATQKTIPPAIPGPIWPGDMIARPVIRRSRTRDVHEVSWTYQFESAGALIY